MNTSHISSDGPDGVWQANDGNYYSADGRLRWNGTNWVWASAPAVSARAENANKSTLKWVVGGVVAVVALFALCCVGVALVSDDDNGKSTKSGDYKPQIESASPPETSESESGTTVGDTIELEGLRDGEDMAVTVMNIVDPATPSDQFFGPSQGNRLVAVQFQLHNIGSATYNSSPGNGAALVDSAGQSFSHTYFGDTTAGASFPGLVNIAPGDTGLGYLVFEVPESSTISLVQFTLNSGFADETGQWTVG